MRQTRCSCRSHRRRYTVDANGVPSLVPEDDQQQHRESAWNRLSTILGDSDDISDSESVGSINVLELDADSGNGEYETQPGWSEMRCVRQASNELIDQSRHHHRARGRTSAHGRVWLAAIASPTSSFVRAQVARAPACHPVRGRLRLEWRRHGRGGDGDGPGGD